MPFKTFERFGEISASELELEEEIKVKHRNGMYLATAVLLSIGVFLYIGNVLFNSTEVMRDTWLNRCDPACQSVLNVSHVGRVTSCIGLQNLFEEPQKNYPTEWKLLVDDRATFLGCSGFPKTMEEIGASERLAKQQSSVKASAQEQKAEEIRAIVADKQGRFEESVTESTLRSYIVHSWQSGNNAAEMNIQMSANFIRLPNAKKEQIAGVIWQKWANVYNHQNPYLALVIYYNSDIERIGTSLGPNASNFFD